MVWRLQNWSRWLLPRQHEVHFVFMSSHSDLWRPQYARKSLRNKFLKVCFEINLFFFIKVFEWISAFHQGWSDVKRSGVSYRIYRRWSASTAISHRQHVRGANFVLSKSHRRPSKMSPSTEAIRLMFTTCLKQRRTFMLRLVVSACENIYTISDLTRRGCKTMQHCMGSLAIKLNLKP